MVDKTELEISISPLIDSRHMTGWTCFVCGREVELDARGNAWGNRELGGDAAGLNVGVVCDGCVKAVAPSLVAGLEAMRAFPVKGGDPIVDCTRCGRELDSPDDEVEVWRFGDLQLGEALCDACEGEAPDEARRALSRLREAPREATTTTHRQDDRPV
jgi:hypothetical protein